MFVPKYTHLLNSFSSRISPQNAHFNMYIGTSKQRQGSPCKNSHPKCFKTTNFDRYHCEYINQYISMRAWARRHCFDKPFNMYIVGKKSKKRFLIQNFPPGVFYNVMFLAYYHLRSCTLVRTHWYHIYL